MVKTFFRIQGKGISLDEMRSHRSLDGASEADDHEGLCACETVSELRRYIRSWAVGDMDEDFEVVIFKGRKVGEVYDGVLTEPREIIERVSVSEFMENDRFCDFE